MQSPLKSSSAQSDARKWQYTTKAIDMCCQVDRWLRVVFETVIGVFVSYSNLHLDGEEEQTTTGIDVL